MGTRCLTVFLNDDNEEIVVMYRQFDGYPEGHGQELADYLAHRKIVNGFGDSNENPDFNGMPCLAGRVITHFKVGIGGFYLYPSGTRDCGEEYVYFVKGLEGEEPQILVSDTYGENDTPNILFQCVASDYKKTLADFEAMQEQLELGND